MAEVDTTPAPESTELRAEDIEISDNWDEITPTFDALGLSEELLRGIYAYGFERPSAIQQVRRDESDMYGVALFSYFYASILLIACHQARING